MKITVEIRHDQNVELLRPGHHLHAGIVHNHTVKLNVRVELRHLLATAQEQPVTQLHDVGLVDNCHLLAMELGRIVEGELGNAIGLGGGDHLEALHHPGHRLVLEAGVLALSLLADDDQVHVDVLGLDPGYARHLHHAGVQVQTLPHPHIERLGVVGFRVERRLKDALQTEAVAINGFDNGLDGNRECRVNFAQEKDLKVDGNSCRLEDLFDGCDELGADTVARDEGGRDPLLGGQLRMQQPK